MPLSELYRLARGGLESSQQKPNSSSADLSHLPGNDEFVELVWENGQIMMQGQSSRVRRNTNFNNFQSHILKPQDRDLGNATNQKTGRYGLMGSALDDFTATVPSSNLGLDQDDEMTPWLGYNDHLNNYCSDFLPEISSVTLDDVPHQNNMASTGKKSILHSTFDGNLPLVPPRRSGVSSITSNTTEYMSPSVPQASSCGFSNTGSGIINFSHFSRPVALACADSRNINTVAPASSLANDRIGLVKKGNIASVSNEMGSHRQPNLLPKMLNTRNSENPGTVSRQDDVNNALPPPQVDGAVANKEMQEGEKMVEPVVASSSVCSGNNPEPTSDDQNQDLKKKSRETDSEGRSEDVEEESVGLRKAVPSRGGTGTKRSRAAEVHNLSERRRRDRINEKMRALQELIPNCNKVDKASMLDEAIEYLKTLQLQVQIMSMGAGLYMPHMMLPAGMQHGPGHMAHYLPMMGMGMGYDMGMVDMNGQARFHGPRGLPFSGPTNFQMMAGPNLQVFGSGHHLAASHHPSGLGISVSQPCRPLIPTSAGITIPSVNNVFGVTAHMEGSAPTNLINNNPRHSPLACNNDKAPDHVKDVLPR